MSKKKPTPLADYAGLLGEIKTRIRQSQARAILAVNAELIHLYWDIGRMLEGRQQHEGWGTAVIPRLAKDLKNALPEVKGFSERNIGRMIAFYRAYPTPEAILPQAAAKLPATSEVTDPAVTADSVLWTIPWFHHVVLLEKVKGLDHRLWYMQQTVAQGWSRSVLELQIKSGSHARQGKAITNFGEHLPPEQSDLVTQSLKDPYVFDFLTLAEPFRERELETGLLRHLQKFLIELGSGFAFVGRQYRLEVGDEDFYVDLLFYHLHLRCFVVIDLKKGAFKAEYAGKMNFYLSVADDKLRHAADAPSIGLILCQDRNKLVAEYALRGMSKPIGVSEYELTRALPKELQSSLPTIESIEAELADAPPKAATSKRLEAMKRKGGQS